MTSLIMRVFRRLARGLVLLSLKILCIVRFAQTETKLWGTKYGNWRLPIDTKVPNNSYIFSAGVGEDISFEQQFLNEFKEVNLVLYDFTPRSLSYLESLFELNKTGDRIYTFEDKHKFYNSGISNFSGYLKVIYPSNHNHVSLRKSTGREEGGIVDDLPVLSLSEEIMKIKMSCRFILKFDIEGSEAEILASSQIVSNMATFQIILLELDFLKFDSVLNWHSPINGILRLFSTHRMYYVDDFNIGLVKK